MFLRLSLTGKGVLAATVGLISLLLGSGLQQPYLNLLGYYLVATLAAALVVAFLEIRGVHLQALAGHPDEQGRRTVWVRLIGSRRAGPFGVAAGDGRHWGDSASVTTPDVAGTRLEAQLRPGKAVKVRLRAAPLGLLSVSKVILAATSGVDSAEARVRPRALPEPGLPFGGLREHMPGEGVRDVHWAASARLQKLVVRRRERLPSPARAPHPPAPAPTQAPPEDRVLLHLATSLASFATIAFSWSLGALTLWVGLGLLLLHAAGTWRSLQRMGRPGWPLLAVLYVGNLAALTWFLLNLKPMRAPSPAVAALLATIVVLFSFDLRNRTYLRAQLLNTMLMLVVVPVTVGLADTVTQGLLFTLALLGVLLASWADGRHALGAPSVTLRELRELPAAWRPLLVLALIAALIHPWLPAIPLPPVPSFGLMSGRGEGGGSWHPGRQGPMDLNARWPQGWGTAVTITGARPERLRSEQLDTYRIGHWWRANREERPWPTGAGRAATLTLMARGFQTLPLPESWVAAQIYLPMRHHFRGRVIGAEVPAYRGYQYRVELALDPVVDRAPPVLAEVRTQDVPPALYPLAYAMVGRETRPDRMLALLVASISVSARYDLEAPVPAPDAEPVVEFLTRTHRGFCVHFASALALTGRALGIPTRVVTGYINGQQDGALLAFHDADAHAWVEAYHDGAWHAYDPTPPARRAPFRADPETVLRLGGLALLLLGVAWGLWRARRRPHPVVRDYARALARLRRAGAAVTLATTSAEACELARMHLSPEEAAAFRELVRRYEPVRFGAG